MRKRLLSAVVALCFLGQSYAGSRGLSPFVPTLPKPKAAFNPVTIYNDTDWDVVYVMRGMYGGAVYSLQRRGMAVYYSGVGDEYATFEVGVCHEMTQGECALGHYELPHNCVERRHFNADLMKSIELVSLTTCAVLCWDGGSESCRQSG
jgi:hypothetical protein